MSAKFVWKEKEHVQYYKVHHEEYLIPFLEHVKRNNLYFYYETKERDSEFNDVVAYYKGSKSINLKDFKKNKKFEHYSKFPLETSNSTHAVPENEMCFTIDYIEYDQTKSDVCGHCGKDICTWGAYIVIGGYAMNTGLDEQVSYTGYFPAPRIIPCKLRCNMHEPEYICNSLKDIPTYYGIEIRFNDKYEMYYALNHTLLFNLYYTDEFRVD